MNPRLLVRAPAGGLVLPARDSRSKTAPHRAARIVALHGHGSSYTSTVRPATAKGTRVTNDSGWRALFSNKELLFVVF